MKMPEHCGIINDDGVWSGEVAAWWYVGPLLVRLRDVKEVRFTDMGLSRTADGQWCWTMWATRVYEAQVWFSGIQPTAEDMLLDGSRRAIHWARKAAGL